MSDAKKMEDTKFYTEMQLATKSLLRQANTKRIAQSHYTAPSFGPGARRRQARSVPNKYDELPSIQSVEHPVLARETAAHAAKVATAALDDEAEKAQARRAGAGAATAREAAYKTMVDDDSEDPRRRTGPSRQRSRERTTFDPRKGQRLALTARDGPAPPEIPVVRRHPVFQRIEHLAWFEISAAVTKATPTAPGRSSRRRSPFGVLRVELFAHATVDHGELALKEITEGPDLSHIKSAPTFIPHGHRAPVAPKLPQMECILDGVDCFVKGTAIADLGVQCKVWIHRRRCRWSRRSDDFRAWRWRFTIYHVETGLCGASRCPRSLVCRGAQGVEDGQALRREGRGGRAAPPLRRRYDDAATSSFFEDDKGKIKPFDVEAGPASCTGRGPLSGAPFSKRRTKDQEAQDVPLRDGAKPGKVLKLGDMPQRYYDDLRSVASEATLASQLFAEGVREVGPPATTCWSGRPGS
ncbi:hypothetical protein JL720_15801 [Aureococcus anophagefferens]|nr:hypothetical protein JL720_15801 [Aureococcus anophagefferens]